MSKRCKRPSLPSSQPRGIRRKPSRKPKLRPETDLPFRAEYLRYPVLFIWERAPLQRCQSSGGTTTRSRLFLQSNPARNLVGTSEPAISLFDRLHPLLECFQSGIAFPARFLLIVTPKGLPEAGFGRKKFRPSVIFCETFPHRPGSNLAATRLAACGRCNSPSLCVKQFLNGARSSVSPRRGPLLTGGRCSRRRTELHASGPHPAHQPACPEQTN